MQAVISGTASQRLARIQRALPHTFTYEIEVLSAHQVADTLNRIDAAASINSANNESKSAIQKDTLTHGSHATRQPDPSALVILSAEELCRCGLFSLDVVQVCPELNAAMLLLPCPACNTCNRIDTRQPLSSFFLVHRYRMPPGGRTASIWPPSCQCSLFRMTSGMATAVLAAGTMAEH
jgi:hypothetical protein